MMRRLIVVVILGGILLAVIALAVLDPRRLEAVLPTAAVELVEDLHARINPDAAKARRGDTPGDFLDDTVEGLRAAGPIAAMAGNQPVFIDDVISGYTTEVGADVPSEIITLRPIMGCMLTPPRDGSRVGYATSDQSDLPLALATYDDDDLAAAVQAFVDHYRETGEARPEMPAALTYMAYDVAVTETTTPVYLVLENRIGNRIWNIHLAPGAQIERVVLLGGAQAGVANLDPVVPLEVLLEDGLQACGIRPAYPLNPGQLLQQPALADATLQEGAAQPLTTQPLTTQSLATRKAEVDAYARWFRDSFGVDALATRAGFDAGTISVVGPVPPEAEGKAVYAPISGSRVLATQGSSLEIRGQVAEGHEFAARVVAIATSFAFGDLTTLRQGVDF